MKRALFCVLGLACLASACAIAIHASDSSVTTQCADCDVGKREADANTDLTAPEVPSAARQAELAAARHRYLTTWRGCKVGPGGLANVPAGLEQEICEAFSNDQLEPRARREWFSWILSRRDMHLAGWYGIIKSAKFDGDQWVVEVRMGPYMVGEEWGILFTPDGCYETWHYSKGAGLTYVSNREPPGEVRRRWIMSD